MLDDHDVYLAEPSGPARAGVVVVHDWYGRLPHVTAACDELAAAGLVALAPDLYRGRATTDPAQAEAFVEALDQAVAAQRLGQPPGARHPARRRRAQAEHRGGVQDGDHPGVAPSSGHKARQVTVWP